MVQVGDKKIVEKEDVLNLYEQLLPWEQEDIKKELGTDLDSLSDEEILWHFSINAIDHVNAKECVAEFNDELLDFYDSSEILKELDERTDVLPCEIIDSLSQRLRDFTTEDIEALERIIDEARRENSHVEEVIGTTTVIMEDDGDVQDGTYESWLTLYNTEFGLPSKTKFKEGDRVEIFARKIN